MAVRVLELYCGIGGMHYALEAVGKPYEVVAAVDINTTVLNVYQYNFPETKMNNRNILSMSSAEINKMKIDMILLSPPCQPFCRSGLQLDTEDSRTDSFCHLLSILPDVDFSYILLENVKGFEVSNAHDKFIHCLARSGFSWQEFLISPSAVGIPNSRLRYYLIGKRTMLPWPFELSGNILESIPGWVNSNSSTPYFHLVLKEKAVWRERRKKLLRKACTSTLHLPPGFCVGDVLDRAVEPETNEANSCIPLPLERYEQAMDIVTFTSTNTCCFTKSYGKYVKGTGSVLDESQFLSNTYDLHIPNSNNLCSRKLRFFTPTEVARLMCFPNSFHFPSQMPMKQKYKALGNSLNVYVVSILLSLLLSGA